MGQIGCARCKKSWCDFVARTFALIAPVDPVLYRVSGSYKTMPGAAKHYLSHQNMSLGSNGVDLVHSFRKIPTWLRGTNFSLIAPGSQCFVLSFMQLRNDPKRTQTLCNAQKHEFRVQWGGFGCACCEKSRCDFVARTFALIAPVDPVLHWVSCNYEMIPKAAKHYATHQNMNLGSNGADWVRSLQKIPMWLCGTNFCFNCTSLSRIAPSFRQLQNNPKCSQTLCNAPKYEFRVQWSGFGAFIAKISDVTSWHELLH
jgi:hypothetical protein